jgi:membrane protein required for colicin V production
MNTVDYLIVGVLLVSTIIGAARGFLRESIGLLSWLGGLWVAWRYAPWLEPHFGGMIGDPPASTWAARTVIVIGVLIAGWLVATILGYLLRHSGLSILVDRLLGSTFGLLRGVVVVAVFILLGRFVELDSVEWWRESALLPYAGELASWIENFAETGMKVLEEQEAAGRASVAGV